MAEENQNSEPSGESKVMGISARGWIAFFLTITVCAMSIVVVDVKEPLYSAFLLALGFYFGQKKQ